jgi:hypothetical protein
MKTRETPIEMAGMEEARLRLDQWRATHRRRAPLPEELWAMAAQLARRHGIQPTAHALGLEYSKLKRLSQPSKDEPKPVPTLPQPTFLELMAPVAAAESMCRIELEGRAGLKLTIELPASSNALVMELCRELRGSSR